MCRRNPGIGQIVRFQSIKAIAFCAVFHRRRRYSTVLIRQYRIFFLSEFFRRIPVRVVNEIAGRTARQAVWAAAVGLICTLESVAIHRYEPIGNRKNDSERSKSSRGFSPCYSLR